MLRAPLEGGLRLRRQLAESDEEGGTGEGGETNSWKVWLVCLVIAFCFIIVWAVIIWYCFCRKKRAAPVAPITAEPAPAPPPSPPKPKPKPKPKPVVAPPAPAPAPLKAWGKVKGVPKLIPVKTPTPLTLRLFHVKAFGVVDADDAKGSGKSDPFLRFVHPPSGKHAATETRRNEDNPCFENRVQLCMPAGFDHPPRILVELWDKDWTKPNSKLAEQTVCLDGKVDEGEEVDDGVNAEVKLKGVDGFPDVKVKFAYDYTFNVPEAAVLELFEIKAFDVPDADERKGKRDSPDMSDPYIRFKLQEVDGDAAAQTKEMMNETNPCWPETLSLNLPVGSPRPPLLQICLWDKDFGNPDDSIASHDIRLPLDEKAEEWRACPKEGSINHTLVGHKPFRDTKISFKYRIKKA
jgi:hypothetical protein